MIFGFLGTTLTQVVAPTIQVKLVLRGSLVTLATTLVQVVECGTLNTG